MKVSQYSAIRALGRGSHRRARYLALVVFAAGSLLVLAPVHAQSDARQYRIETLAMRDGSVEIEGTRYKTVDALRSKLIEIRKRHPNSYVGLNFENGASFKQIGGAILMIQQTGTFSKLGFLIEPRPVTPNTPNKPPHQQK